MIPLCQDSWVSTTEARAFALENTLTGNVIRFQPSYDCTNDTISYNSTAMIKIANGDTITVYSPCEQRVFKPGTLVTVEKLNLHGRVIQKTKREIVEQFPKDHSNYPYWECISCKYPNTVGLIKTI